ncbi:MAG: hypothetical protein ACRD3O_19205, partial [Terriglobia bacterium]
SVVKYMNLLAGDDVVMRHPRSMQRCPALGRRGDSGWPEAPGEGVLAELFGTASQCWRFLLVAVVALLLAGSPRVFAGPSAPPAGAPVVLRGTLGTLPGNHPTLRTSSKSVKLAGQSPYLLHTLQDKRLLNQELQLVGTFGPGHDFVVQKLFAVKAGKLYRVQYYCPVCNITSVQPGHCYCCGRETKLQEVPVSSSH